jgi:ribonuclease inhibitor
MIVTIHGDQITSRDEMHLALAQALEFPDYYGANLDALWDCLTGWISPPITIVWENYSVSQRVLGEYADKVVELIQEACEKVHCLELVPK